MNKYRLLKRIKSILFALATILVANPTSGQDAGYFQQGVKYDIKAQLQGLDTLIASCNINYQNNSPHPLDTVYFHLWMNALSDKTSPFSQQMLIANNRDFYFLKEKDMGGYLSLDGKIGQQTVGINYVDKSKEIAYIILPSTLQPGGAVEFRLEYTLKIPSLVTRMGVSDDIINLVHWYPKTAVFDQSGWHTMPYLSWGEYYSEYGDYSIEFNHSDEMKVAASFIKKQSPVSSIIRIQKVGDVPIYVFPKKQNSNSVHGSVGSVKINIHFHSQEKIWDNALSYTQDIIKYFEKEIGPFPYSELTVVQGPQHQASAMEYPGTIVVNKIASIRDLDYYLAHEIAHQYFYAALGFNERDEAFMDEGLATFYEDKYTTNKYGNHHYNAKAPRFIHLPVEPVATIYGHKHLCNRRRGQPLATKPLDSHPFAYAVNAYPRSATLFKIIEKHLGEKSFKSAIKNIYESYKHKHISSNAFFNELERETRQSMHWVRAVTSGAGLGIYTVKKNKNAKLIVSSTEVDYPVHVIADRLDTVLSARGGAVLLDQNLLSYKNLMIDPYNIMSTSPNKTILNRSFLPDIKLGINAGTPNHTNISVLPLIYYNTTDKWMPSLAVFNSTIPSSNTKWLINPAYSIEKKALNGEAWFSQDFHFSPTRYLQPRLSIKKYSYQQNDIHGYYLGYQKLAGELNYHMTDMKNWDKHQRISLSYMYIQEDLAFFTSFEDFTIEPESFSNIRLGYNYFNSNGITKSNYNITIDAVPKYTNGGFFVRATASASKKIFYRPTKTFTARVWAGYFIENTQRYSLSYNNRVVKGTLGLMQNAYNDYSYDAYYFDRNTNRIRQASPYGNGGGFALQFDGNRNIGQSNDLAFALNLQLDPPMRLPKFLPIKLFFDIGGYTQGPKSQSSEVIYLYSGGVRLSYLQDALTINIPFFNSKEINNLFLEESRSFLNRISITFDILKLNPWEKFDRIDFFND